MKSILKKLLESRRTGYLEVDQTLTIRDISSDVARFSDCPQAVKQGHNICLGFPELFGLEDVFKSIFKGQRSRFKLKGIERSNAQNNPLYIDIEAIGYEDEDTGEKTLVFFFEDATERMILRRTLVHRSNEKNLLYTALATAKDYIDKIIGSMADALLVTTPSGKIKTINQATQELFGYSEKELLGQPISLVISDDQFPIQSEQATRLNADKLFKHIECTCKQKSGQEITVSFSCSAIHTEVGTSPDLVYVGRDITARKQAQKALEYARSQAELACQSKSRFLANMSHEIRTPMNAVLGMTDLLLDTNLTLEQRDFVNTIRSSGDGLLVIINQILDLSKLEAGQMRLDSFDFDLSDCIEAVIGLLAPTAHTKGIEVGALIANNVPTQLHGDEGRLRQILTNLVGNAIKFTDQGEVIVKVELEQVELEPQTPAMATLRLTVTDTGIGISPEDQCKLFQPFSQVDTSTTRQYGGTGLGLNICHQIITLMGGKIGVTSQLGVGSTFWLTLPFKTSVQRASPVQSLAQDLVGRRLLVVDDNETNRKVVSYQALRWGMQVDEACDATVALQALHQKYHQGQGYDAVLIDMQMPKINGIMLGQQIKANPSWQSLPLVMLTSSDQRDEAKQALTTAFAAYLVKPIRKSQLLDTLTEVVLLHPAQNCGEIIPLPPERPQLPMTSAFKGLVNSPKALKILVAEDNSVNRKVALKLLEYLNYEADVATNGKEVLQQMQKNPYDLILMDCQMPVLDGYATTQEIRRHYGGLGNTITAEVRRPVVIAMTANAMKEDKERCLASGMDDYLSKPVNKGKLQAVLDHWSTVISSH
ncbi:MAG: response regulator [Cyanothece sp. SIO1E1]|nr:response regulator [Cyanothece sp. SIO1E1]